MLAAKRACRSVATVAGALAVMLAWASGGAIRAQSPHSSLGKVHAQTSCSEPAQEEFTHGVMLLHHMTYPQARESFRKVAAIDSTCAMAYWGVAMTLFQPMWPTRPGPRDLRLGWEMAQKARAAPHKTRREQLLVAAVDAFFQDPESSDYWARIRRWETAMESAYVALPNEEEIAAFYALAHLAVAQIGSGQRQNHDRAAALLTKILATNPSHPGAVHYLIHANDIPPRAGDSPDIVSGYDRIAPENPHALHMPTHIYVWLGDWPRTIAGNLKAADAALKHPAGDQGQYIWDEFPHAIEYAVYGYLQRGADDAAREQLTRLQQQPRLEPTFKTAFHLASTAARFTLERKAWTEAVELRPRDPATLPWDRFPWPEAVVHFARGMGAVHSGQAPLARESEARLNELEAVARRAEETLFARSIGVLRLSLSAWIANTSGDGPRAIQVMRQAVELEGQTPKHAVTPAPTIPALELLGDLLMQQGNPREGLAAYERSLAAYPNRFNSLLGAARSAHQAGDREKARAFYRKLAAIADPQSRRNGLADMHQFLSKP